MGLNEIYSNQAKGQSNDSEGSANLWIPKYRDEKSDSKGMDMSRL